MKGLKLRSVFMLHSWRVAGIELPFRLRPLSLGTCGSQKLIKHSAADGTQHLSAEVHKTMPPPLTKEVQRKMIHAHTPCARTPVY